MSDITSDIASDLAALRLVWESRREAVRPILARIDPRGMTRPARDPDEGEWLADRGEETFVEDEAAGRAARAYYARRYSRPSESGEG